jgi:hypothetical protein
MLDDLCVMGSWVLTKVQRSALIGGAIYLFKIVRKLNNAKLRDVLLVLDHREGRLKHCKFYFLDWTISM